MTTEYSDGDTLYGADMDNLVESTERNGVLTGLGVTENTPTPDMNVVVAAGNGFAGVTYFNKASGTVVPITAAHASLNRIDLIVSNSSGTLSAIAGTPAAVPNPPDLPDDSIIFAFVEVDTTVTQIFDADITDRRLWLGLIQKEMVDTSIAVLSQNEIVTGNWTHQGTVNFENDLLVEAGKLLQFAYSGATVVGSLKGDATYDMRLGGNMIQGSSGEFWWGDGVDTCGYIQATSGYWTIKRPDSNTIFSFPYDGLDATRLNSFGGYDIELNPASGGEILLKVAGSTVLRISQTYMWGSVNSSWNSIHPNSSCTSLLGTVSGPKYWSYLNVGTVNDGNCSIYPEPQKAFNVLTTLRHTLKEGAPRGKIDSKNYPGPLRTYDIEKKQPSNKGRNLSAVVDHLIFAMGDIEDLINGLESRLIALETGDN